MSGEGVRSRVLTVLAGLLITLVVNIIDYQFDLSLKSSFASNPQGVSAFLGSFYFWTGIAGLVQQVFFTGPLLRRFGIVAALLRSPLVGEDLDLTRDRAPPRDLDL